MNIEHLENGPITQAAIGLALSCIREMKSEFVRRAADVVDEQTAQQLANDSAHAVMNTTLAAIISAVEGQ